MGAVLAVLAVLLVTAAVTGSDSRAPAAQRTAASPELVDAIAGVPPGTLAVVGLGDAANPPRAVSDPALVVNGKPEVRYIGAEYCPFCAAQRWPLIQALSRFGTFTGLSTTRSASGDVHPNTPTFTFHGATYSSDYLTLTARELYTSERSGAGYAALEKPSAEEAALLARYGGGFPLLDLGGRFVQVGASYNPDVLHGLQWTEIAGAMADPTSAVARGVDGSANILTSYLCELTGGQPRTVCIAPGVIAAGKAGGHG